MLSFRFAVDILDFALNLKYDVLKDKQSSCVVML